LINEDIVAIGRTCEPDFSALILSPNPWGVANVNRSGCAEEVAVTVLLTVTNAKLTSPIPNPQL